jgi:hypothetical protein
MWSKAPRSLELCIRRKQWWALRSCRFNCTDGCMGHGMQNNQEWQPNLGERDLRLLGCDAVFLGGFDCLLWKMKAQRSFETSEDTHPKPKQCRIPRDGNWILFNCWRPTGLSYVNRTGIYRISKSHIWQPYVLVIAGAFSLFWRLSTVVLWFLFCSRKCCGKSCVLTAPGIHTKPATQFTQNQQQQHCGCSESSWTADVVIEIITVHSKRTFSNKLIMYTTNQKGETVNQRDKNAVLIWLVYLID